MEEEEEEEEAWCKFIPNSAPVRPLTPWGSFLRVDGTNIRLIFIKEANMYQAESL